MKKLLALLLLSPLVVSEEEYPIELTCTGGSAAILYIYLTKEKTGSWFKFVNPYFMSIKKGNERINNKKINLNKFIINEKEIIINKSLGRLPERRSWTIDRLTGTIQMGGGRYSGICSKGLKEYNEKQI